MSPRKCQIRVVYPLKAVTDAISWFSNVCQELNKIPVIFSLWHLWNICLNFAKKVTGSFLYNRTGRITGPKIQFWPFFIKKWFFEVTSEFFTFLCSMLNSKTPELNEARNLKFCLIQFFFNKKRLKMGVFEDTLFSWINFANFAQNS